MNRLKEIIVSELGAELNIDEGQYPCSVPSFTVPRDRFIEAARALKKADARLVAERATD